MAPTLTTVSVFNTQNFLSTPSNRERIVKKKNFNSKRNNRSFKVKSTAFASFSRLTETAVKLCAFETHISQNRENLLALRQALTL